MTTSYLEETDRSLPEYPLPEQIERLIEAGKYSNVENRVTKVCVCVQEGLVRRNESSGRRREERGRAGRHG